MALILVGGVLLAFGAIAYFGQRAAFRPPSPRATRRMAYASGAFSFFGLGFVVAAVVLGRGVHWLALVQSGVALLMTANWLRDRRIRDGHESWEEQSIGRADAR